MFIEIVLVIVVLLAWYKLYEWRIDKASNIPGDTSLPFIGMMLLLRKCNSFNDIWEKIARPIFKKYEDQGIVRIWLGPMYTVTVMDPDLVQIVAESPFAKDKGPAYSLLFSEVIGGLFVQNGGQIVREMRKQMLGQLTKKIVNTEHINVFVDKSKLLVNYIKSNVAGEEINAVHIIGNFFVDITSATLLGVSTNEGYEINYNFFHNLEKVMPIVCYEVASYGYLWRFIAQYTGRLTEIRKHTDPIKKLLDQILDQRSLINATRTSDKSPETIRDSISIEQNKIEKYTDYLLRRAKEKNLSREQIRMELSDLLIAGVDTSSVTIASALLFMALFPDVQEKAYQEQISIFSDSSRDPTIEDLQSMEYLSMIIKEVIRKTTPIGFFKSISQDIKLGKYILPKGAYTMIGGQMIHNSPKHWQRPDSFYPEHFLPENESARHRYAYLPFGIGPRTCPGFRYGLLSVKVTLSTILRSFKLSTSTKYEDIEYEIQLLLQVKGGYPVKFEERIKSI